MTSLAYVGPVTVMAHERYKIPSGDQPCRRRVKNQRFGDRPCLNLEGQGYATLRLNAQANFILT